VGSDEVFKLEENPSPYIRPNSAYNDGTSSTFGQPNLWADGTQQQDFSALRNLSGRCQSDADCDDGQWCNGMETCIDGTCQPGASPCPGLPCNEVHDVCNQCTTDVECDDGVFCNGAERCVDNQCVAGVAPCGDTCEHCNEALDACVWCMFDLDSSGFIGPGDFAFFAGCFGQAYGPGAACRVCNFDGDPDGFVGPGDFAGFAGCFGGSCGTCPNCWATGQRPARLRSGPRVIVRLVPVRTPTPTDVVTVLPKGSDTFPVGASAAIEVWARVVDADSALAALYADVISASTNVTPVAIQPSTALGLFARAVLPPSDATPEAGAVWAKLGGCAPLGEQTLGAAGRWARVATLTVRLSRVDTVRLALQPAQAGYGVAVLGELGLLAADEVEYGACDLRIVPPGTAHGHTPVPSGVESPLEAATGTDRR
jgi:hypothetical protein